MEIKDLTDAELELMVRETEETHDSRLRKKLIEERQRRFKYE